MNWNNELKQCDESCPICGGLGYVEMEAGVALCPNDPRKFHNTGVSELDLDVPKKLKQTPTLKTMGKVLGELLEKGFGLVYLQGNYGIGKTVSARAYTARAVRQCPYGGGIYYRRQSELVNWLRTSYDTDFGQKEYKTRLDELKNARWLVIDELGRDRMTDFARESMNEILDARYLGAIQEFTSTILISNFAPEKIFEPYIVDRIRDSKNKVFSFTSKSLRVNAQV